MNEDNKQQTDDVEATDKEQENINEEVAETAENENIEPEQVEEQEDPLASLQAELEKKTREADDNKDKYLRALAELDNLKRRTKIEKENDLKYANFNIISDLLVILDDFERAIQSGKSETFDKDAYVSGVEMIEKQFHDLLFKKYGVVKYGEVGEEFDPNIHQAMMMAEGDYEKEVLANIFRKGYKLHDRIVRPAQVQVGKPANKDE